MVKKIKEKERTNNMTYSNKNQTKYPNGKYPQKGEIYYITAGPTSSTGFEQWSNRHGIIVSSDYVNKTSTTVQIVYITTRTRPHYPTYVDISLPQLHREAICGQIMTIDKSRIVEFKSKLHQKQLKKINKALQFGLGLNNVNCKRMKHRKG